MKLFSSFAALLVVTTTGFAQALYWDINDNVTGAGGATPGGTWNSSGSNKTWGNSAGTANTAKWTDNRTAYFSAGADATGSYTVTLGSAITAAGLVVEEGSPTFTGGNTLSVTGNLDVAATSTVTFSNSTTTIGGNILGTGVVVKSGTGSLTLGSSVNFGGTLTLSGGTLNLGGSTTITTLNITGNSVIDFGSAATTSLLVSTLNISAGATLTINNWANAVDYFQASAFTGATAEVRGSGTASQIVFSGFAGSSTLWMSSGQITPVPEPSTYGALLLGIATAGCIWRRRRQTT
jgi:hypothetical protein